MLIPAGKLRQEYFTSEDEGGPLRAPVGYSAASYRTPVPKRKGPNAHYNSDIYRDLRLKE